MSKVTELSVENFCKITALNIALGAHITEISGQAHPARAAPSIRSGCF